MRPKSYSVLFPNCLHISIIINILALTLLLVVVYLLKCQKSNATETKEQLKEQETNRQPIESIKANQLGKESSVKPNRIAIGPFTNSSTQTDCIKVRPHEQSQLIKKHGNNKIEELKSATQLSQIMEKNLRQELELEQQRNRFLQEKTIKMEEELSLAYQKIAEVSKRATPKRQFSADGPEQVSEQLLNLKNELEFCQKKLAQNYQTQRELKNQLQSYRQIQQHSLSHPELFRLRQMNKQYKQIIFNMQKYLLEGHFQNRHNFSFTDL